MSGLDCLRTELLKRGYSNAQANARVVAGVLDILANTPNEEYANIQAAREQRDSLWNDIGRLKLLKEDAYKEYEEANALRRKYKSDNYELLKAANVAKYNEVQAYINKFFHALDDAETPEGRDRLRAAQTYVNSVDVDTKYDNTAFIIGLASILSGGNTGAIDQLKKINPKLSRTDHL